MHALDSPSRRAGCAQSLPQNSLRTVVLSSLVFEAKRSNAKRIRASFHSRLLITVAHRVKSGLSPRLGPMRGKSWETAKMRRSMSSQTKKPRHTATTSSDDMTKRNTSSTLRDYCTIVADTRNPPSTHNMTTSHGQVFEYCLIKPLANNYIRQSLYAVLQVPCRLSPCRSLRAVQGGRCARRLSTTVCLTGIFPLPHTQNALSPTQALPNAMAQALTSQLP